jgi:ribosome-binding protein aMBF1 (putative translation factor)
MNKKSRLLAQRGAEVAKAYEAWVDMRRRTRNPRIDKGEANYASVTVCKRWDSFETFLSDMGTPKAGQSIDRVNGGGNYEPGNCRWTTAVVQSRNRSCVKLSEDKIQEMKRMRGEKKMSQASLAVMFGVSQSMVSSVLRGKSWT